MFASLKQKITPYLPTSWWQWIGGLLLQLVIAITIFQAVSYWRESSLLDADGSVTLPAFHLQSLEGMPFSSEQLKDKKTVVYFFAPWCQVCHVSIGNLQTLYNQHQDDDDLNVIAIALDFSTKQEVAEFVANKNLTFPVLLGNYNLGAQFNIRAFPTYYTTDEAQRITGKSLGYSSFAGLAMRVL